VVASGPQGLLVDLRGAIGHVPAAEAGERPVRSGAWRRATAHWEGWVVAVGDDLVHLSIRPPQDRVAEGVREGEVVEMLADRAVVRLGDDGRMAIVPSGELSWHPALEPPRLAPGTRIAGRVVGLTVDHGPVLSPRSLVPTPWPAIALALAPGARVTARVHGLAGDRACVRTEAAPRAVAIVPAGRLPPGAVPGTGVEATVARVDPASGALLLDALSLRAAATRALPPEPGAETPGRPGPEPAA
jgi:hypothetical protein